MLEVAKQKKFKRKEVEEYLKGEWIKEFSGIKSTSEVRRRLRITSETQDKRDFSMFSGFRLELILWIIYRKLSGKKQVKQEKKRKEQQKKVLEHIRNFSPVRLKNRSWQKSIGKCRKKSKKLNKKVKSIHVRAV